MAPISLFVIPFGLAYGVAAVESGLPPAQAIIMSIAVFSGAAQFTVLDFWFQPGILIALLLTVFAVSTRHILMGAALAPWLNGLSRKKRILALVFLSDANFADSYGAYRGGERDVGILMGGGMILWINWCIGTAIGAAAGAGLGDLNQYGIDLIMVIFFTALLVQQWQGKSDLLPALVAVIVAYFGLIYLPLGWNIIAAALAGGLTGGLLHGR
jgi:4-azaleucine resistance transporter AzlC